MSSLKINFRTSLAIKFALIGLLFSAVACGPDKNSDPHGRGNGNSPNHDDELVPDALTEELVLNSNEQLFSFKTAGDSQTSLHTSGATSLSSSLGSGSKELFALNIVDADGKAKKYLKDAKFDAFHVVKDGNQLAYIARISEEDFKQLKMKNGGWFIFRNGQKPLMLKNRTYLQYIRDPGNYVGQVESTGGLVFSYGTYIDLEGKPLSYGKNIDEVTAAQFVSGDYVALKRKILNKEVTTLVNVKTGFRRAYDNYFTPDFVQIKNDGKGLMSDIHQSHNWFTNDTMITRLEQEMDAKNINSSKRSKVFPDNELQYCLWFNASVRIPGQEAALITCYVSAGKPNAGYQLTMVTPGIATADGAGWTFNFLFKMKDQSALDGIKVSRPFVQGKEFTLAKNENKILYVHHTDATKNKKIKPNMGTIFEIRPSNDLTQFVIIGEKANGDRVMDTYEGATGNLVTTKDINEN